MSGEFSFFASNDKFYFEWNQILNEICCYFFVRVGNKDDVWMVKLSNFILEINFKINFRWDKDGENNNLWNKKWCVNNCADFMIKYRKCF